MATMGLDRSLTKFQDIGQERNVFMKRCIYHAKSRWNYPLIKVTA